MKQEALIGEKTMRSFHEFVNSGAFLNTFWKEIENPLDVEKRLNFPKVTFDIPTKIITGKVQNIFYTKNPICISLDNGTSWKVTKEQWDYLSHIGREPKKGKRVQLEMYLDGTIKSVDIL